MEKNEIFRLQSYWEKRFETEIDYEWFAKYDKFKELMLGLLKPSDRILVLGCGSSNLSFDLYSDGYMNVTSVDYAQNLIDRLRSENVDYPTMKWICTDIRSMNCFDDCSFDVVIEKATIDSLLTGEKDPWNPSDEALTEIDSVLCEVSRILDPHTGRFISVTFCQPHFRLIYYGKEKYDWSVDMKHFGTDFHYFFYWMERGKKLDYPALDYYLYPWKNSQKETNSVLLTDNDDEKFLFKINI